MKLLATISTLLVTLTTVGLYGESQQCVQLRSDFNSQVALVDDIYRLAGCEAVAGNHDSAFNYLAMAKEKGFNDVDWLLADVMLENLHQDRRWQKTVTQMARAQQDALIEAYLAK